MRLRPVAVSQPLIPGPATSCRFGDRPDYRRLIQITSFREGERRRGTERAYLPSFQMSVASFQSFPTFSQITTNLPLISWGVAPLVLRVNVPISRAAEAPNDFTSRVVRASVYRSLKQTPPNTIARRPGPVGACSDAELADHMRRQIAISRLHGEGYRKLWARLRWAGVRVSPRRVRRVMRENGLLASHRVGRTETKPHDGTIITDKVNQMWGTDMTQTMTIGEGRAYVFVAVEHANSEVVGVHAARSANRFEALEPVRQGVHRCFGAIAPGVAHGLKLRHDHGSNYMSGDFQDEIKCLGIEASPSFVREPEGNGVAERFIRTLKENLLWVRSFDTIEELRAALVEFATHYNETWLVARHRYRTPVQVRADQSRLDRNAIADLKLAA